MQGTLNIGSVGTSSVMELVQEAIRLTPGLCCKVVYSRDKARGQKFAERVGAEECCDEYEEMIARDDIDIVYIASPNSLHVSQALKAMAHGKHVFIEKPVAVTEAELQKLIAAAKDNGVFFFEAITTLFMPNFIACRELLPKLGNIRSAEFCYGQFSSKYDAYVRGEDPSNFSTQMQGGTLNDLGIYCIHAAVDLFGRPQNVSYEADHGPNGIDLSGTLLLQYPQLVCKIEVAKDKDLKSGCRIVGDNGFFAESGPLNAFASCDAEIGGAPVCIDRQKDENRMIYEMARFRDAIRDHDQDFFNAMARQTMIATAILEQAHASERQAPQ